jgi:serine/threonine protein kinase
MDRTTERPRIVHCPNNFNVTVSLIPYTEANETPQPLKSQVVTFISPDHPWAYNIISSKPEKCLNHHAPGWGYVFFGIKLPKVSEGVYRDPSPNEVQRVAIKRLNKQVVNESIQQGKKENPYVELLRMQQLGDNVHVLQCIEAAEDQTFLYNIMPYCEEESLVECIPWNSGRGLEEDRVRVYFKHILQNLQYLRRHGICHRDLSPDNCMLYNGRVLFTDLAMSFRVVNPEEFIRETGIFGKPAYQPPEVYLQLPFNGFACDLWSCAVILFNLLTGETLYEIPHYNNLLFKYFILARGISSTSCLNERMIEVFEELRDEERQRMTLLRISQYTMALEDCLERIGRKRMALWRIAQITMALNPDYLDLLDGMLRLCPQERWELDKVQAFMESQP